MDFVPDQLFDGRRIRSLTIVDAHSQLSPAVDARRRYKGADVVSTLKRVTRKYGFPREIRLDNGPEFISKDLDLWAYMNGVKLEFSRPGKPTDNAFIESFNGKFRSASNLVLLFIRSERGMILLKKEDHHEYGERALLDGTHRRLAGVSGHRYRAISWPG